MPLGLEKVLRGIMRYRVSCRADMVEEFKRVRDHPNPTAVFFTCADSRMLPTRFTQSHIGDMLTVRNAGNLVPHSCLYNPALATTEPAVLELGCITNNIKHVIICGHSDCKAVNTLYNIRNDIRPTIQLSPLEAWIRRHGTKSMEHFHDLETNGFGKALEFEAELPNKRFIAYIDPDDKFCVEDKLSQVNCLQQLQNVASYEFLRNKLLKGELHLHALWFDIYTGDIYYFSRRQKRFVVVIEETVESLILEAQYQIYH